MRCEGCSLSQCKQAYKLLTCNQVHCTHSQADTSHACCCCTYMYCSLQGLVLQVLPGAPHSLQLLEGHPFTTAMVAASPAQGQPGGPAALPAALVVSGEQLPPFQVCEVACYRSTSVLSCA